MEGGRLRARRRARRRALRAPVARTSSRSHPPLPPFPPILLPLSAQDTEFPGVVARPVGSFSSQTDYHYQTLRCNVDMLKMIQLGVTFADEAGNVADGCPTFQVRGKWRRRRRRRRGRRSGKREG